MALTETEKAVLNAVNASRTAAECIKHLGTFGYVIVPAVATFSMCEAANEGAVTGSSITHDEAESAWREMLVAWRRESAKTAQTGG